MALSRDERWPPPSPDIHLCPAPGTAGTGPSLGSLHNVLLPGTSKSPAQEGHFVFERTWSLIWAGAALGNVDAIWKWKGDSAAGSAPGMGGEQQILVLPSPKPHHCSPALQHPPIHAPPKYLQNTGLLFSLGSFHSGTPLNFSYHGLSLGIFTVHDISTYILPCFVV